MLAALATLRISYEADDKTLPRAVSVSLGRVWRAVIGGQDRERAFAALEVATLLALRRALRNGTVWSEHNLTFRSRERLFIPAMKWEARRRAHYPRLAPPTRCEAFLEPLLERAAARIPTGRCRGRSNTSRRAAEIAVGLGSAGQPSGLRDQVVSFRDARGLFGCDPKVRDRSGVVAHPLEQVGLDCMQAVVARETGVLVEHCE